MAFSTELISRAESFVQDFVSKNDPSHDYSHIQRVRGLAEHIAATEPYIYDQQTVILAALLHDVGDYKYLPAGDASGAYLVYNFLISAGASESLARAVQTIVSAVGYSIEMRDREKAARVLAIHPELGPVQDADRLDALGAVGMGRCFCFGGAHAHVFGLEDSVSYFREKLLGLGGLMKTATGRAMAEARTERVKLFLKWWEEEIKGEKEGIEDENGEEIKDYDGVT